MVACLVATRQERRVHFCGSGDHCDFRRSFVFAWVFGGCSTVGCFLFCPDVFAFFSFGKYLPTYALEFSKMGYVTFNEVWIPLGLLLALAIVIGILGIRRLQKRINS